MVQPSGILSFGIFVKRKSNNESKFLEEETEKY